MRIKITCISKKMQFSGKILVILFTLFITVSCTFNYNPNTPPEPGNIIVIIGDGMGFEQVKAASLYAAGTEEGLSFQAFPVRAEVRTAAFGGGVTDSAAAATAIATGHKVVNGVISKAFFGDLETLLEYYKRFGKRVGLVSTAFITTQHRQPLELITLREATMRK